jgi:hypothetical protein
MGITASHSTIRKIGMRLFITRGNGSRLVGDASTEWVKSSLSYYNGNCVEVAGLTGEVISVRNSRDPRGAILSFTPAEWGAFVGGVRNGEFDRNQ